MMERKKIKIKTTFNSSTLLALGCSLAGDRGTVTCFLARPGAPRLPSDRPPNPARPVPRAHNYGVGETRATPVTAGIRGNFRGCFQNELPWTRERREVMIWGIWWPNTSAFICLRLWSCLVIVHARINQADLGMQHRDTTVRAIYLPLSIRR